MKKLKNYFHYEGIHILLTLVLALTSNPATACVALNYADVTLVIEFGVTLSPFTRLPVKQEHCLTRLKIYLLTPLEVLYTELNPVTEKPRGSH